MLICPITSERQHFDRRGRCQVLVCIIEAESRVVLLGLQGLRMKPKSDERSHAMTGCPPPPRTSYISVLSRLFGFLSADPLLYVFFLCWQIFGVILFFFRLRNFHGVGFTQILGVGVQGLCPVWSEA